MRKMSFVFACVAVLAAVSVATAGTINLYFVRGCPSTDGAGGTPPGFNVTPGNPTIVLAPNSSAAQAHYRSGSLYLYMDAGCAGNGVGDEAVSSVGLDVNAQVIAAGAGTSLTASGFSVYNTAANTGAANGPWSSPSPNTPTLGSVAGAAGNIVTNSRAVLVPSSAADPLWNSYSPNTGGSTTNAGVCTNGKYNVGGVNGHYRVARLDLTAGTAVGGGAAVPVTQYGLYLRVGTLKITRVYDPTAPNAGAASELVSFGYDAAGANPDATLNGSTDVGVNSAVADATVVIRKIGDVVGPDPNGVTSPLYPNGQVTIEDVNYMYQNYRGTTNAAVIAVADCVGPDPNGATSPDYRNCQVTIEDVNYAYQTLRGS